MCNRYSDQTLNLDFLDYIVMYGINESQLYGLQNNADYDISVNWPFL